LRRFGHFCVCSASRTRVTDRSVAEQARPGFCSGCGSTVSWRDVSPQMREASADAARCSDRNLQTDPVARCPGPPRNQRALLLGTERRRTRRGPGRSTHRLGRRDTHTPKATNADRGSDGPGHQQSFQHVKPCLMSCTSRGAALADGATPMAVAATTRVRITWDPAFDLEDEAVRPRDGSATTPILRAKRPKGIGYFPIFCLLELLLLVPTAENRGYEPVGRVTTNSVLPATLCTSMVP
jgi:hypothetical protein